MNISRRKQLLESIVVLQSVNDIFLILKDAMMMVTFATPKE